MILLPDANALHADPLCDGPSWQVVAREIRNGDLRVAISEVVLAEAVANYRRRLEKLRAGAEKWLRELRAVRASAEVYELVQATLDGLAEDYEKRLRQALDDLEAETVGYPDADHAIAVSRAVERRPPCDENGDGYRDTLLWLTALELAEEEDVALVTRDSDFLDDDGGGLNPALMSEAEERGVQIDRFESVAQFVLEHVVDIPNEGIPDHAEELRTEELSEYVWDGVLEDALEHVVADASDLALPPSAEEVSVGYIEDLGEIRHIRKLRELDNGESLIEFEISAVAEFTFSCDESDVEDHEGIFAVGPKLEWRTLASLKKEVCFDCVATLGRFGEPLGLEVAKVHALPDDPDLEAWDSEICGCVGLAR